MNLPRAAILSVGDELLGGRIINTNAAFIATRLTEAGFLVAATETVGDEEFSIADAIKALRARADVVIVVGGLGPTPDDVTREAIAGAAGKLLVVDRGLKRRIAERTGGRAASRNARMARIPEGAQIFPNPIGVAAGLRVDVGGTPVYALPGVPIEMEAMFEESIVPDLERTFTNAAPIPMRILKIFGLREAEVAEKLGELLDRTGQPAVGVTVKDGVITATIVGEGADARAEAIRERLGEHVFGEGDDTLAAILFAQLQAKNLGFATAESVTGGMVASLFVEVPSASEVLRGGIVAYGDASKHALLGVPKALLRRAGAVSEEVALRMARGARKAFGAEVAVATTGAAGPAPDPHGAPVGRVILAASGPKPGKRGERTVALSYTGTRNAIRRRAAYAALDFVRRHLARA
jgi:nicotinamide-nucleotide amidase